MSQDTAQNGVGGAGGATGTSIGGTGGGWTLSNYGGDEYTITPTNGTAGTSGYVTITRTA